MGYKKMCKICGENKATIPDRNKQNNNKPEVCPKCHGKRLANDMTNVLIAENKRLKRL